MHTKTWTYIQ